MPKTTANSTARSGWFATTHWSMVCRAGDVNAPRSQEALESLCRTYWYPLYAYVRKRGYAVEDAQDLTQEFFARMLDSSFLAKADPLRGRFRSFLLTSMERFLANEWDRATAQKRGGGKAPVPIQTAEGETRYGVEPADEKSPEQIFEYNWAVTLLEEVMRKLEADHVERGQGDMWNALKSCLVVSPDEESRAELASRLGLSEGAVRVAVHRLRASYRGLLRREIAGTLDSEAEVDAEMRHLFKVLAKK